MNTERSLPRCLLLVALVMFLICVFASMPIAATESADPSSDSFCVEVGGDSGGFQNLYLNGVCITDCNGNQFSLNDPRAPLKKLFVGSQRSLGGAAVIDLSGSGLNRDKPFKEVKLHLTLERTWGCDCCYDRWDKFTLDVTDLVTKKKNEPYTVLLKAYNSYQVGKADAVDICDCNKNKLKYFSPTHKDGHYGSWDYSSMDRLSLLDWFCVEFGGDSGVCQKLYLNGICITDCDGNQFALNDPREPLKKYIDLSGSGLNRDKPLKEVKLHLTLERKWGFSVMYERWDKFTLDVSDLVTTKEDKPYTVLLKAYNSYQVGKADAVDICDCNKNKLKHFPPTHDTGHYGSWDYSSMDRLSLLDWFCVELDGDIGFCQKLYLNGICITDCDGNQFASDQFVLHASVPTELKGCLDSGCGKVFADIYLSGSGLNRDKPFKEVKLHLTLMRKWGYKGGYKRLDDFTLDVTNLVMKKEDKPNTVLLKAYHSYKVGEADAVDICDRNKNKLKHLPSTHDEGHYGSWD